MYQRDNFKESVSRLNKSMENLDKIDKNTEITQEMTEQLILKLLLQQIRLQKKQEKDNEQNSPSTSSTASYTNIKSPDMIQSQTQFSSSPIDSSFGSINNNMNNIKKKLYQKSMSNFDKMEESDSDDNGGYYRRLNAKFQKSIPKSNNNNKNKNH